MQSEEWRRGEYYIACRRHVFTMVMIMEVVSMSKALDSVGLE
jgi:hypothetical protein